MVNILLLNFLQWAFGITLPENQKTNCDEKKVSCNSLDSRLLWLDMRYMTKYWSVSVQIWYNNGDKMSNSKKDILPKKGIFIFSCVYDPVYSRETNRIFTKNMKQHSASKRRSRWYSFIFLQCFQSSGCV